MRIDRYPDVDMDLLPMNPTPPDFWQDRAACFGGCNLIEFRSTGVQVLSRIHF